MLQQKELKISFNLPIWKERLMIVIWYWWLYCAPFDLPTVPCVSPFRWLEENDRPCSQHSITAHMAMLTTWCDRDDNTGKDTSNILFWVGRLQSSVFTIRFTCSWISVTGNYSFNLNTSHKAGGWLENGCNFFGISLAFYMFKYAQLQQWICNVIFLFFITSSK